MAGLSEEKVQALSDIAHKLRIHSIESTIESNSGHPTSCASMAEIISVLFFNTMRYTVKDPRNANNDRFVLSKGHAAPILYAAWAEAGLFPVDDLKTLRKLSSPLDGHPTPNLSFVDVATGSLGQGLSCAAGMAYTGKHFDKSDYRVYCLIGDGESAEGSIWEALAFASHYKLDNLVNIIDVNRLGQSEATMYQHDMDVYKKRVEAFGWNAIVVDGHNIREVVAALDAAAAHKGQPTCIIAKTFKGKYLEGIENSDSWHGKPLPKAKGDEVIAQLRKHIKTQDKLGFEMLPISEPEFKLTNNVFGEQQLKLSKLPNYKLGEQIATRLAYGNALVNIGATNPRVVALDGDVKNSTYSIKFKEAYPDRFVECFIAEQNLAGVAIGCSTRFRTVPFVSTFAAFFSRAFDQIRMGAISLANVKFAGSHVGVSIGEDGPSQMALEDLGMFRSIPNGVVFYPSDAVSTEYAVELAANTRNICYIRTSRPNAAVIYANDEKFEIGKAKIVQQSDNDYCTVVGGGVTLHEALKASKNGSKRLRIIDVFTVKPIDWKTIYESVKQTNNRLIVVEDHYREGGIGEALSEELLANNVNLSDFKYKHLYVKEIPKSGKPEELVAKYGIDAAAINTAAGSF